MNPLPSRLLALASAASLLALAGGCVTRSAARAQAKAAYESGRRAGLAEAASATVVQVDGQVQNHTLPWTDGLTLIKVLLDANYQGPGDPSFITIYRHGMQIPVDPQALLHHKRDQMIPIEPGDRVDVRP